MSTEKDVTEVYRTTEDRVILLWEMDPPKGVNKEIKKKNRRGSKIYGASSDS